MKSSMAWLSCALIAGAAALGLARGMAPDTPAKDQPSVEQLIERLDSADFPAREEATRALMGRLEALPALRQARRSGSPEVRRRATRIIEVLRAQANKRRVPRLLERVKGGQVDQFIDQMLAMPRQVDDPAWDALAALAEAIRQRANKEYKKTVPFPDMEKMGKLWRTATPDRIDGLFDKSRFLSGWRALAYQVSDRNGVVYCILVCQGPIRGDSQIGHSVVFANGDIRLAGPNGGAGTICDSIVFCEGSIETDDVARCILIATGTITIKGANEGNVVVIPNAREPLGLLKLFDVRQAGVAVGPAGAGVVVSEVRAGSPFARAGFQVGDRVTAADGKKVSNPEQFRRVVRRGTMAEEDVVFTVQRAGRTLDIPVALTD
jgi:hypothetical protein